MRILHRYKNYREIYDGRKYTIKEQGDVHTLIVRDVNMEDLADVECQAKNTEGVITDRVGLDVLCKFILSKIKICGFKFYCHFHNFESGLHLAFWCM